jgi:hypothetical protein
MKVKCLQKMYESSTQVVFENLASQIKEMLTCKSIDLNSFKTETVKKNRQESLECDDECLANERSKSLAQALQIDPENSQVFSQLAKPRPIYTDFLRNFAREDPKFVLNTEKRLEQLVSECRAVSGKKSLHMPIMKINERRFIHELCGYYDIETQSFDPEPNRNVCLYASREKSSIPSVLLSQSLDLFGGKASSGVNQMSRVLNLKQINQQANQSPIKSNMSNLDGYLKLSSAYAVLAEDGADETAAKPSAARSSANEKVIDYFDLTE